MNIPVANDADDLMLSTKNLNYAVFVFVNLLIKDKSQALKKQAGKNNITDKGGYFEWSWQIRLQIS